MKFNVRGEIYELDDDALTFKDVRDIEKVTGILFTEEGSRNFVAQAGMAGLQAVVWIAMRKRNPDMSFSDTDDIPVASLMEVEGGKPDPRRGGGSKRVPTRPRRSSPSTSGSSPQASSD